MKKSIILLLSGSALVLLAACTASSNWPDVSDDGLVRVEHKKSRANAIYVLKDADFNGYEKIKLEEPSIAFRKYWKEDINSSRTLSRISDRDMEKMIARGKKLLTEEFTKRLEKGGYKVVNEGGANVLEVKPSIVDLDVYAPDPSNLSNAWTQTYTRGSGEATLILELYDSMTNQLLARVIDRKVDQDSYISRIPRTQASNIADARRAFNEWARMLAKGLDEAKLGSLKPADTGE